MTHASGSPSTLQVELVYAGLHGTIWSLLGCFPEQTTVVPTVWLS
jgi:hypothetical protein